MTEQEIEQFPKSASEYLHKQKDLTYQQEVHQFFEVIKYYRKELKDANKKLVYVSCQYSKCFEIMTELVEIITELDCDFEIVHTAEQFIKENK